MGARTKGAGRVALVGLLTALSLVFLYLSNLAPTGRIGIVAVAGLVPAAAVISGGLSSGFLCYAATGILGLLIAPDKGTVVLYLLFFGCYPMIKSLIERPCKPLHAWPLKLLFFNLILSVFWFGLRSLFLPFLPAVLNSLWLVYLASNFVFILYDLGFSGLAGFYAVRIDKIIRFRK